MLGKQLAPSLVFFLACFLSFSGISSWPVAPHCGWEHRGWGVEQAAPRVPISFEVLMQTRELSNFRGQTQGIEKLGQGTWSGRDSRRVRGKTLGSEKRGVERASPLQ